MPQETPPLARGWGTTARVIYFAEVLGGTSTRAAKPLKPRASLATRIRVSLACVNVSWWGVFKEWYCLRFCVKQTFFPSRGEVGLRAPP